MRWLHLTPLNAFIIGLWLLYGAHHSNAQTACGCPSADSCSPCSGGISSITFKNHGPSTYIWVIDDGVEIFGEPVVSGATFTVEGQSNGKFDGNRIDLYSFAFSAQELVINCGMEFDPAIFYGNLTMVSATSKNGGPLCCTSDDGSDDDPEILGCPINIQVAATAACNAVVTWTAPTVDQCDAILTSTRVSGETFLLGTTEVVYTATNSNNKTSTCRFNVTVVDTGKPEVIKSTAPIVINADAQCKAIATWTPPEFSDCSQITLTPNYNPGSSFPVGSTNVTYTARDLAGNTATSTFTVTVKDVTGPTIVKCPELINLNVTGNCKAKATWEPPVFTDACGPVIVSSSHNPGADFPVGSTEVTYTAVDGAGNESFCKFDVVVKDQVAPVISSCPEDTTLSVTALPGSIAVDWRAPVVSDDCGIVSTTSSHNPGDSFPVGTTVVTYTATDISGNTATCSFKINILWEVTNLEISQLLTPDGNQANDEWVIGNIEKYENNKVVIVDRWGSVVYTATRYDNTRNVWKGENSRGNIVPTGTYFYSISIHSGPSVIEKKGFIEVIR